MGFSHFKWSDLEDCGIYHAKKSLQWQILVTPWDSYDFLAIFGLIARVWALQAEVNIPGNEEPLFKHPLITEKFVQ